MPLQKNPFPDDPSSCTFPDHKSTQKVIMLLLRFQRWQQEQQQRAAASEAASGGSAAATAAAAAKMTPDFLRDQSAT